PPRPRNLPNLQAADPPAHHHQRGSFPGRKVRNRPGISSRSFRNHGPSCGNVSGPCHRADRRTGLQPGPRRETCSPADGGAKRLDGATHFEAPTSACRGSTFTGTGRASGSDSLRFLKFRRRSMPLWDFRFFVVSSYLTTTNTREVGLVLTVLNHFHLFPSGPLAQSAEGPLTL